MYVEQSSLYSLLFDIFKNFNSFNTSRLTITFVSTINYTIMRKLFFSASIAAVMLFTSCSSDSHTEVPITGEGEIELFFDHSINGDNLLLNASQHTNSNGETLMVSRLSYIVSNIVLFKEDGTTYSVPRESSFFVVTEENGRNTISLANVPAANYTGIRFGVGVDQERFIEGQAAQQDFWDLAATLNMTWSWSVGYKFINFEGTFTTAEHPTPRVFRVHMGSHGTNLDNYREVTINFPQTARVRTNSTPNVHFVVDANVILDGETKIRLSEHVNANNQVNIMVNALRAPQIANNAQAAMFTVDHIHNSGHSH